jgi:hypothetical protein
MPWATRTSGGQTGDVGTAKANERGIPPRCGTAALRMSTVAAGRAREGGLTAQSLQRQEGCEKGGGKPERFGLSFGVALVTTYLLQQG